MIKELLKKVSIIIEYLLEKIYLPIDRNNIKRTLSIKQIPYRKDRWGGKISYSEWAHVIGLFQGLIFHYLKNRIDPLILDVGCGKGLLGLSCLPYLNDGGKYVGLDVMKSNIDFCQGYFEQDIMDFVHLDANNPAYAPDQSSYQVRYPFDDQSFDMATALSVWTHLAESDAKFYFKEVARILKPKGIFIMTCWYLNDDYNEETLSSAMVSRFNGGIPKDKIFGKSAYDSSSWKTLNWVDPPEQVCGISTEAMQELLTISGLTIKEYYPGNWKEMSGMYYQDVLIFEK